MTAIWKKELRGYFLTPLGYVFLGIFLLMSGTFFTFFNLNSASSDLNTLFGNLVYLFMVLTPLLTMRLLSEENRSKTDQLLFTSPLSAGLVVLGKYAAACTVLITALALTLPYVAIIAAYATPYPGLIFSNYLGFFFIGCCYISIGVLMSALTENQLSAAVMTIAAILLLQVLEAVGPTFTIPYLSWLNKVIPRGSLHANFDLFASGIISPSGIVYDISFCAVMLHFAVRVVDSRRWKER